MFELQPEMLAEDGGEHLSIAGRVGDRGRLRATEGQGAEDVAGRATGPSADHPLRSPGPARIMAGRAAWVTTACSAGSAGVGPVSSAPMASASSAGCQWKPWARGHPMRCSSRAWSAVSHALGDGREPERAGQACDGSGER